MNKQNMATQMAHNTVRDKTRQKLETDGQAMKKRAKRTGILDKSANSNCKN
jgi:hypothetical protein